MACLFSCFSASKHKRPRLFIKATSSKDPRRGVQDHKALLQAKKLENQEHAEKPSDTEAESGVKLKEQSVEWGTENKNPSEELPIKEISDELIGQNGGKEDEESVEEQQGTRVALESSERKGSELVPVSEDRSQSCSRTHHSLKDLAFERFEEADDRDGEKGRDFVMLESSESLFSLSIDSRKRVNEVDFGGEREVTSPITKKENIPRMVEARLSEDGNRNARDQAIELVANATENGSDRETVKVNKELQEDCEKENISVELENRCEEPMLDLSSKKKLADKEIAVDTSLSSWLVESEGANSLENSDSKSKNSPNVKKGRPVLGELNLHELKPEFVSESKSITRDPNPDDVPLIGTIGSYLSCTKQTRNRMITI